MKGVSAEARKFLKIYAAGPMPKRYRTVTDGFPGFQ